jgi:hypothetical protein
MEPKKTEINNRIKKNFIRMNIIFLWSRKFTLSNRYLLLFDFKLLRSVGCFFNANAKTLNANGSFLVANTKTLNANAKFLNANGSFLNANANFLISKGSLLIAKANFLNDDGSFLKVNVCFNDSRAYYFGSHLVVSVVC